MPNAAPLPDDLPVITQYSASSTFPLPLYPALLFPAQEGEERAVETGRHR